MDITIPARPEREQLQEKPTAMWTLSAFADEISPDLDEQIRVLLANDIHHLELRGVWEHNVLALSDDALTTVEARLRTAGIAVSSIGSPIGKIGIDDDFAPHLRDFRRALAIAERLDCRFVRIFSFFLPEGDDPARHREAVLDRLGQFLPLAAARGITLLHENERHIYGDTPARCLDLLSAFDSPHFRAVWDPANFVQVGVRPFDEGFPALRPYIAYVHVKDSLLDSKAVVPAGEGDGQWPETIAALHDSGFDGFFSLEPHLASGGAFSGFSGPDLFTTAASAFKVLLEKATIPWK